MTLISIILILVVMYVFRLLSPQEAAVYPNVIKYDGLSYEYAETVKSSPLKFSRLKHASQEGYRVLACKGVSAEAEVYIYEGARKYRRYEALKH